MSSGQMFFEAERFQIRFKRGKAWSTTWRFGEGILGHWSHVEFDAWNSHETSVCGTQRVHWKVNHSHWTL